MNVIIFYNRATHILHIHIGSITIINKKKATKWIEYFHLSPSHTSHQFEDVTSVQDFLACHPLTRYDHYSRPISRMLSGEQKVLTSQDPVVFAVTSGTSGHANIIPMLSRQTKIFFLEVGIFKLLYFSL